MTDDDLLVAQLAAVIAAGFATKLSYEPSSPIIQKHWDQTAKTAVYLARAIITEASKRE